MNRFKRSLMGSTIVAGVALIAAPAFAQDGTAPTPAAAAATTDQTTAPVSNSSNSEIVVTGSLISKNTVSASPIVTLSSDNLAKSGIQTFQAALQLLPANNGAALGNSFTANGAFAGGASAVSLRGLTTNSTLVLFNGLRGAYYPLADDGVRNFVDLNTIPDEIVDRVDVLEDGASAAYGADAVAGVINVITKKSFKGFDATAEGGATGRGTYGNQRFQALVGFGDLATQGWNFYVGGHYIHQSELRSKDLPYPYNTANQSGICYQGTCGSDLRANAPGDGYAGVSTSVPVFLVRPYDATNTTAQGRYQFLNPSTGCNGLSAYNPTADQLAAFPSSPTTVCTQDQVHDGGIIEPRMQRLGGAARFSVNITNDIHGYVEGNFEQSKSSYTGYGLAGAAPTNSVLRANAPAGIDYLPYSTATNAVNYYPGSIALTLPVYVCPVSTVGACNAGNGTLNPNNPFASQNEVARLIGTLPDAQQFTEERNQAYRVAAGINGTFADDWNFKLDGTWAGNRLRETYKGYVYIQHLLDVVKDGSFNFVDPSANSQQELNYLMPKLVHNDNSNEYDVEGSISHSFFDLPGGPLSVAVGGSWRHESIDSPSANPDYDGPTDRYFVINAFGTVGSRDVESGYFQVDAPVLDILKLSGSGRYDHYSTGSSHFSPKGSVIFSPVKQLSVRGTVSGGFRIPSFAESSSLPTTGYVPAINNLPDSYLATFSKPGGVCSFEAQANCTSYITAASLGETTISNPNLKPEITRNFDVGIDIKPISGLKFSVDYYNIRKKNAIISAPFADAVNAYYAGEPIPSGYTVIPGEADPDHPGALPLISQVEAEFINATTVKTDGFDFSVHFNHTFPNNWTLSVDGNAEYIHKLNTTFPDGHTEHYAGTIGNYNLTAGTGTQRWKATLQPTIDFNKKGSISATVYYTSGYNLSAEDQGNVAGDCGLDSGIQSCNVRRFIHTDLTGTLNAGDHFTFYVNVLNVFNVRPPLDTVTYGGYLYNPVVAEAGIIGRAFRVGAKVHL